jgi:hypothetical protein
LHVIPTVLLQTAKDGTRVTYCDDLALCEVGLLSWWVGVGCKNVVLALSGWIAGMTTLLAFSVYPFISRKLPYAGLDLSTPDAWQFQWIGVLGGSAMLPILSAPLAVICFLVIGRILLHRRGPADSPPVSDCAGRERQTPPRWQFSLRDILILVAVVAASLSAMTTLQPYPGWMRDGCRIIGGSFAESPWGLFLVEDVAEVVLITTAARWLMFGQSRLLAKCGFLAAAILISGLFIGVLDVYVSATIYPGTLPLMGTARIAGWMVGPAIVTAISAASFLLLRLSGCKTEPTAAPLTQFASGMEA